MIRVDTKPSEQLLWPRLGGPADEIGVRRNTPAFGRLTPASADGSCTPRTLKSRRRPLNGSGFLYWKECRNSPLNASRPLQSGMIGSCSYPVAVIT